MMNRRLFFISCIVAVIAGHGLQAQTALAVGPAEFIRDMGREAIDSLTAHNLTTNERQKRFRDILKRAFDMRTIARFTLGRYWRVASKQERQEYYGLFEDFIVQAYAIRFQDYSGQAFEVGKVQEINKRDKWVLSKIIQPKGPPIQIHWRVRSGNGHRIVDVVVEGISMGITQRDEFASVIRNSGGKIAGLLDALRKKTGKK